MLTQIKERVVYRLKREKDIFTNKVKPDEKDAAFGDFFGIFFCGSLMMVILCFLVIIGFITTLWGAVIEMIIGSNIIGAFMLRHHGL